MPALAIAFLFLAGISAAHAYAGSVSPPTGLTVKMVSPYRANLTWAPPAGSPVAGYEIEQAVGDLSPGSFSNSTDTTFFSHDNTTSFVDTGLQPGMSYNFTVFAIASSPPSNAVAAFTGVTVPGAPTGLAAKATTFSKIRLGWTPPASNGGSPITGYEVERARGDLSFGAFANSTGTLFFSYGNATSFTDAGLQPDTTYNYTVFAKNAAGAGPPSSPARGTTPKELSLYLDSVNMTGGALAGIPVSLEGSKGTVIDSGHTSMTFHITYGGRYVAVAGNYSGYFFDNWAGGSENKSRQVTPTSNMTLTAYYAQSTLPTFNMMALLKTDSPAYQNDSQILFRYLENGDYLLIHGSASQFATTLQNVQAAKSEVRPGVTVIPTAMYTKIADITSQVPALPKGLGLVFYDYENGTGFSPEFTTNETVSIGYFDQAENAVRQYNANTGGSAKLLVAPSFGELRAANWDWGLAAKHMDMIDVQFGGYTKLSTLFKYAPPVVSQIGTESPGTPVFAELSLLPGRGSPPVTSGDIFSLDRDGVGGFLPWYDQSNTTQSAILQQFFGLLPRSVPLPPANLSSSAASPSQVDLAWSSPDRNYSDISGYKIERVAGNGTSWSVLVPDTESNATSYSDSGLAPGTTYTYRISAMNVMGMGKPSGNATSATP